MQQENRSYDILARGFEMTTKHLHRLLKTILFDLNGISKLEK